MLVVLNELGAQRLRVGLRPKCRVLLQSANARRTLPKTIRHLPAVMVGHLREEKDPRTYFDAARLLAHHTDILFDHVGAAFDPTLGAQARAPRPAPKAKTLTARFLSTIATIPLPSGTARPVHRRSLRLRMILPRLSKVQTRRKARLQADATPSVSASTTNLT